MLRWLKSWLLRRRSQADRLVYPYYDGKQVRMGDPFQLWRGMVNHSKLNMDTMLEAVDIGQEPETTIAVEAITEVFGLSRLDTYTGIGLTDGQVLDVLLDISNYFDELKKKHSRGQTLSSPTVSEFSNSQVPQSEPTSSSSDSTPASSEPRPVDPSVSCKP